MNSDIRIAPSMMCADLWRLAEQTQELEAAGVELLHFDLMDAHFVPNMPLGLGMLEMMRARTALPFDAHLMVENNDFFIDKLAAIGVQMISVHAESARHLDRTLSLIRAAGTQAGVALNPATPLSTLDYVLDRLDFVLMMTVNPGFAAQKLVPSGLRKMADCPGLSASPRRRHPHPGRWQRQLRSTFRPWSRPGPTSWWAGRAASSTRMPASPRTSCALVRPSPPG